MISLSQLQQVFTANPKGCVKYADAINMACTRFNINTPLRIAAFLAQIGHESGQLVYVREIWGPTAGQKGYEGRADLGNTEPGDGRKYLGRGFIQITGRANYQKLSDDLNTDFIGSPQLLEQPEYAAMSAGWFWNQKGLNTLADREQFITITRRINGGTNGLAARQALYAKAKQILGV
jgi:putative chitinase